MIRFSPGASLGDVFFLRTKSRARPDLRKHSADLGAFIINRTEASFRVEIIAVPSVPLLENEKPGRRMKAPYDSFFMETPKRLLQGSRRFVLGKNSESDEIGGTGFDRQRTATGETAIALLRIFKRDPRRGTINDYSHR